MAQVLGHRHELLFLALLLLNDLQVFQLERVFCLVGDSLTVLPGCLSTPRSGVLIPGVTQGCCEEQPGWGVSSLGLWMLARSCILSGGGGDSREQCKNLARRGAQTGEGWRFMAVNLQG